MIRLEVPYQTPSGAGTGDMLKANNLGDVASAAQARLNLNTRSYGEIAGADAALRYGGITFDGTSGKFITGLTQTFGTQDFSVWLRFRVPTANPANTCCLVAFGNGTTAHATGGMMIYISTLGLFKIAFQGSVPDTNVSRYTYSIVAAYAGQVVDAHLTRVGSTITLFIDGAAVSLGTEDTGTPPAWSGSFTGTYIYIGNAGGAGVGETSITAIHRVSIFNMALSSSQVTETLSNGIVQSLRLGNFTPLYDTDVAGKWDTGTDSWTGGNGSVARVASQSDGSATKSNCLKLTLSGGSALHSTYVATSALASSRSYRLRGWVYVPAANGSAKKFQIIEANTGVTIQASTAAATWTWVDVSWVQSTTLTTLPRFYVATSGDSLTVNGDGDVMYLSGITVTANGCVQDVDLTVGAGYYFPDRTANNLWCEGTTSGWQHIFPAKGGQYAIVKTLQHSDISSTADTTKLFDLPPNHAVMDVQFDREVGFDAGITVRVGPAGSGTKYVNDQNVNTTGIINVSPASGNGATESASAATAIYGKKSGATTVGTTTLRARIAVKG